MSARDNHDKEVADAIIAALEQGTAPWQKPWAPGKPQAGGGLPYNPNSGNEYRGGNVVFLMARQAQMGSTDSRWMTYKQAAALGAQVRKGEKSTPVQYWKKSVRKGKGDDAGDGDDAPDNKGGRTSLTVFHARVFNASQIDGLPPPPPVPEIPERVRHAAVEAVMDRLGVPIDHGGNQAFYTPSNDRIRMPEQHQFTDPSRYFSTLLHEGGHATGHPSRLNRDLSGGFGSQSYAREELRAEIFSLMASQKLQLGHDPGQHHAYVANWIQLLKDDPREVYRAASDAQKMVDFLEIQAPDLVAGLETSHAEEQRAMFVREFDLVLQRDYGVTAADAGVDSNLLERYAASGSAQDAVRDFANDYDLVERDAWGPKASPEVLAELEALRAQRDALKNALSDVLNVEPEMRAEVRRAVKP